VHDLLYQFVHNSADATTLQQLRIAASGLYDKVITSRNAMRLQGHMDFFYGVWVWDSKPEPSEAKVAILTRLYDADPDGMTSREIINLCDGTPEESTIREGLRNLCKQGLIEKVSKRYRLTPEGRKTMDRLIRSK